MSRFTAAIIGMAAVATTLPLGGSGWQVETSPDVHPAVLNAVNCPTPQFCVAVGWKGGGSTISALGEVWRGGHWTQSTFSSPLSASLAAVVCGGVNNCVAVGDGGSVKKPVPVAATYNGQVWKRDALPPGRPSALESIACASRGLCFAAGETGSLGAVLAWNGHAWSVVSKVNDELSGVACQSAASCVAVGISHSGHAFTDTWSKGMWKGAVLAVPLNTPDALIGVSCKGISFCMSVGFQTSRSNVQSMLAMTWNGAKWSRIAAPGSSGSRTPVPLAMACESARFCVVTGYVATRAGTLPLALQWDVNQWKTLSLPHLGDGNAIIDGVTCSVTVCVGVGKFIGGSGIQPMVVKDVMS
jgi:hypothetical protein